MLVPIAVAIVVGLIGYGFRSIKPPSLKICGSVDSPPVTSPRIRLSDGRYVAYKEIGVSKDDANYKIIVVHGFRSSKNVALPVLQELIDEFKIYLLFFDRPGYGESDPDPSRSVKSEAYDIQELADKLQIGSKFYVLGLSLGAYAAYGCLKYIPHRLAGASLVAPFVNYWWARVPQNILDQGFKRLPPSDRRTFRVARYIPWLLCWWMTQKWFTAKAGGADIFNQRDLEILEKFSGEPDTDEEKILQQGDHESLHRDLMAAYAKWEFDPTDLENPFPQNEGSVHIWQGLDDKMIYPEINRYISRKLPWVQYHEVPNEGHVFFFEEQYLEAILKALLFG